MEALFFRSPVRRELPTTTMIPDKLGPYRIDELLGRGGMGTVYQGVDESSGQRVAVKVLSPALVDDSNFRERFVTEVETLKQLHHPHIVEMYGFGEQDGQLFYSMELVEGRTLQDELNAGRRFGWREVTQLGVQICNALKHAHDRGVIHRDLKPANLVLSSEGQVKLLDFGIAKLFGATHVTIVGGVIGTADYMSPEQAAGKPVTARSDLYSLGTVLYCLLHGRPPFHGKSLPEIIHSLRFENPLPIRQLVPEVPPELERILIQLLDKDPEQRIATPLALAKRLQAMEFALSIDTQVEPPAADEPPSTPSNGHTAADRHAEGTRPGIPPPGDPSPSDRSGEAEGLDTEVGKVGNEPGGGGRDQTPTALDGSRPPGGDDPTLMSTSARPTSDLSDGDPEYQEQQYQLADPSEATIASRAGGTSRKSDAEPIAKNHFTTVQADRERRRHATGGTDHDGPPWLKPLVTAAMLAIVAALVVGAWYATRPSSADELYARLAGLAEDADAEGFRAASDDVDRFLELYPNDPRAGDVRNWQRDLEAARLQRQLERQARRVGGASYLEPVQQAYLRAMRAKRTDEEEARRRLQLLLAVFGHEVGLDATGQECVDLARHELSRLKTAPAQPRADHGDQLARRLQWAREHLDEKALREFQHGLIGLFGDEPWAAETVRECREELERERERELERENGP